MIKVLPNTLLAACALLGALPAHAVHFSFSNVPGAQIAFDGAGNFSFTPTGPNIPNIQIEDGSAVGLLGSLEGTFAIGAITPDGTGSMAPVTGHGTLTVFDGATPFTATISWQSIYQKGVGLTLNVDGEPNLGSFSYAGSNPDLASLAASLQGGATVTLQFIPARTLAQLKATARSTAFSGTVTGVADGGTTAAFLGLSIIGMAAAVRRRQA